MRIVPFKWPNLLGQPLEVEVLFLEAGVGGFSVQRAAAYDAPISERYHSARSATALANSPAAGTCQHVTTSHAVPAHKVGSEGVLSEQHRHWIVDMGGRNIPVRVDALQSLNKSLLRARRSSRVSNDTAGSLIAS